MLELVHHAAVGDEDEGVLAVADLVLPGQGAEELLMPGGGEELHGHGVDLAGLDGGAHHAAQVALAHGPEAGEGVARLVGQHVHVAAGAVEVGEDEGGLVGGELRAVAAGGLALLAQDVQQLVVPEEVGKLRRLRAQLPVHLPAGGQDLVGGALGVRVAVGEQQHIVPVFQLIHTQPPLLVLLHPGHDGHHVPGDLVPEGRHLGGAVAVAAQAVIAQLEIVVVAHVLRLGGAVLHQLVVELVQLRLVGVEPLSLRLVGRLADRPIRALLVGPQLGQGQLLPVPLHHGGGVELLVLALQLVLLLHEGHVLRVEGPHRDLQVGEQQLPQPLLQLGAEGAVQQGPVHLLADLLKGGTRLVGKIVFLVIKRVPGVDGVADIGQGQGGADLLLGLVEGPVGLHRLVGGDRLGDPPGDLLPLGLDRRQVGTDIRHFTELHGHTPFLYFRGGPAPSRPAPGPGRGSGAAV